MNKADREKRALFVLTNTSGQIFHIQGRPAITGDIEEARQIQSDLMEQETMTVITVYMPERVL